MSDVIVRAKFRINSVTEFGSSNRRFNMSAIYGKDGENANFAKATPNGTLDIYVDGDTWAGQNWKIGDELYLNFEKVPKPGTV